MHGHTDDRSPYAKASGDRPFPAERGVSRKAVPTRLVIPRSEDGEPLTPAEATFVRYVLRKPNPVEAMRAAFPELTIAPDGTAVTNQRLGTMAGGVLRRPNVRARIAELQRRAMDQAVCGLAEHLQTLALLRDEAADAGQYGAAVQAETQRGRAAGLYIDRTQDVPFALTQAEIVERLERLLPEILAAHPQLVVRAMERSGGLRERVRAVLQEDN